MNSLTTYQENLMTLNRFIDEKEISKHILNLKEDLVVIHHTNIVILLT